MIEQFEQIETKSTSPAAELIWDHFGPDASGTAQHFLTHLQEFLLNNVTAGAWECSTQSEGDMHCAVRCQMTDTEAATAVARVLRAGPRSSVPAITDGSDQHSDSSG